MVAKYKKNESFNRRNLIFSAILGAIILAVIGFLINANLKLHEKRTELTAQAEALETELRVLKKERAQLEDWISQLKEGDYLVEVARERLGLKYPGEKVVVIVPPTADEEKKEKEERIWYEKILQFFVRD